MQSDWDWRDGIEMFKQIHRRKYKYNGDRSHIQAMIGRTKS